MKTPENDKIPYDLIARFLSGEADQDDLIDIERWKSLSERNEQTFGECKRIWEKSGQTSLFTDIDIDQEWNYFQSAIETELVPAKRRSFSFYALRFAAVILAGLILSVSTYLIYNKISYKTYTAENRVLEIRLPDGSELNLNKNSKVKIKKSFAEKRELQLEGEAFFDVVKDPDNPFLVRNENLLVEVLGTSFSVRAFKDEDQIDVVVETGKVAVYEEQKSELKEILIRGDRLSYVKKTGSVFIDKNRDVNYHAWKTGILVFEGEKLGEVFNKLEEIYGVRFIIEDKSVLNCPLTVRFEGKGIEYIMNTIGKTFDLEISISNSQVRVSGQGC